MSDLSKVVGEVNLYTMTISDVANPSLPTSGSSGTVILGAAGVAAVTVAAAYLASRKGMLPRLPR